MAQKRIVHLRVYRGKELNYDANGKVKNENNKVSLTHDTVEWSNYMKHLQANGFCKVIVEGAFIADKDGFAPAKHGDIDTEVKNAFEGEKEVITDPKDLRIAQLEKQMRELMDKSKSKVSVKENKKDVEVTVAVEATEKAPKLPKGKKLDDLSRGKLEEIFPNVQALEPANVGEFRDQVRVKYPNQY